MVADAQANGWALVQTEFRQVQFDADAAGNAADYLYDLAYRLTRSTDAEGNVGYRKVNEQKGQGGVGADGLPANAGAKRQEVEEVEARLVGGVEVVQDEQDRPAA